ncbi:histidine phosphatase family protein [Williamsia deligens]|uniref:Histidine phosphatase family protein n=1 Tax=Williamsia deligens TaxID=321325 RepID=A0ABW3GAR0_9NOCA|nr:histidine phosphatase family protein [Williamsia deligens]
MTLVAAGRTGPNRDLRFGGEGSPLDSRGRRDVTALDCRFADAVAGPERSVVETAATLAERVVVVDSLRSIDLGSWTGRRPEEIDISDLGAWFADPRATPHGGESVVDFLGRIRSALRTLAGGPVVVVAAKPVVQAAVVAHRGLGAADFLGVDITPATTWAVDISIDG